MSPSVISLLGMDKVAIFGWLAEIHRRKANLSLHYPNTPEIARFLEYSNDSRWTNGCHQEMVALGNASGLPFSIYSNGARPPSTRPWNRAEHAAMVERYNSKSIAAASTSANSVEDSTCDVVSSQASTPGYGMVVSAEHGRRATFRRRLLP